MGVTWTNTTATTAYRWAPVAGIAATAVAVHHTATEDSTWDAGAAVQNMPNDPATLKYCHAWYDAQGDPENKASYKFPHHRTKGGPANLAAVRNGLARLSGADIDAKDAVESHLRAHLEDGGGGQDHHHHGRLHVDQRLLATVTALLRARDGRPRPAKDKLGRGVQITAHADTADMLIYDEIGFWGITAGDVAEALTGVTGDLNVRVNSPGGDVFDGIAIYNMLLGHPGQVTVTVDGLAASAASFVAMAGDTVQMNRASQMMIHDAAGLVVGDAADMTEMAATLNRISDTIAGIYAAKAGGDAADWRTAMQAETWYSATEAVAAGLADQGPKEKPRQPDPAPEPGEPKPVEPQQLAAAFGFRYAGRENAPAPPDIPNTHAVDVAALAEAMKGALR